MNKELKIIIICCLFILTFKLAIYHSELGNAERIEHLGDYKYYIQTSKWMTGMEYDETNRTYQYPPLYSIFIIPSLYLPSTSYLIIMDDVLATLSLIPLFLLIRRYLNPCASGLLSTIVILTSIAFSTRFGFKAPNALSAFLFIYFIYFLIDARTKNKKFIYASLLFGLLISTKYVFFFLLPMIIIWFSIGRKKPINKIKELIKFSMIPFMLFIPWIIRNIYYHGLTIKGMFGGYITLINNRMHYAYRLSEKITSITTHHLANYILIYFMVFMVGVTMIMLYKKKKDNCLDYYSRNDRVFHYVLVVNFIVFFLLPSLTYWSNILNWRYLSLIAPVYISLGLMPFLKIIMSFSKKYKILRV